MYLSITELPSQVKSSLDNRDAAKWMNTYNKAIGMTPTDKDVARARREAWESVKTAPSSFSFKIKASVEDIDKDREIIDVQSIKDHLDSFIEYGGNLINEHGNYVVGCIWGWEPIKENGMDGVEVMGNIFGGDQVYDEARKAFVNGRNNLSVAGEATEGKYQCDERGCYTRRHVKQLLEISLCDVPANKHATMSWYNKNAKLTKSASVESMRLNVDEYELHKDYTACPVQAIKKSLLDSGYVDVHAKPEGVLMKMDADHANYYLTDLILKGYKVTKDPEGLFVESREKAQESAFKKAYTQGYLYDDGAVTPAIPRDEFEAMYECGYIRKGDDGVYRFNYETNRISLRIRPRSRVRLQPVHQTVHARHV